MLEPTLSRILRPDGRTCLPARQGTRPAPAPLRLTAEKQKGKIFNIFLMCAPDKIFSIKERKFFLFAFLLTQKSAVASHPLCAPSADWNKGRQEKKIALAPPNPCARNEKELSIFLLTAWKYFCIIIVRIVSNVSSITLF